MPDGVWSLEYAVLAIALAGASWAILHHFSPARGRRAAIFLVVGLAGITVLFSAAWTVRSTQHIASAVYVLTETPADARRGQMRDDGFVTSNACKSCHPAQYHSWHDSFHRTMTQRASPESVIGNFNNVSLQSRGRSYHLSRRGKEYWVNMVDPVWEHSYVDQGIYPNDVPTTGEGPPRVDRRIVMTTGSHHMQTYWVGTGTEEDGRLFNLGFTWLNDDERWVPREDVFLRPQNAARQFTSWHNNCIECHAVAGESHHDPATGFFNPQVAELGIACEACHGPAEEHIRANRDPRRRYQLRSRGEGDPTIVNPARLDPRASAQVCGQCHGINVFKVEVQNKGVRYRPGGDLTETRIILRTNPDNLWPDERADWPRLQAHIKRQTPTFIEERLWPDGMVRVSGREHNAMIESACFQTGELSCLSCHSMHTPAALDDQLAPDKLNDKGCVQCHEQFVAPEAIVAHTHHRLDSEGSACLNCHMPHTTYGLMKAIRSHLIDSPTVQATLATGRPNACNLCHLDQTLAWTSERLSSWYGQPPVAHGELSRDQQTVSAALLDVLTGDANQRALAAWHFGWPPAQEASGTDWMGPYLGHLLADPYACVRFIAHRSLRTLPIYRDFRFDYVGDSASIGRARDEAIGRWMRNRPVRLERSGATVLMDNAMLDVQTLSRLSRERDDRVIDLRE